jgi:hypothetical protein
VNPDQALLWNAGTCRSANKGEAQAGDPCKGKSTDAEHRDGAVRCREEGSVTGWTEGTAVTRQGQVANRRREEPHDQGNAV